MKLVTWNCNGAFRRKFEHIAAFDADIYVIQECENPANSSADYREWAASHIWAGKNSSKGVGVFVKNGLSLYALDWPDHGLQQFLPVRVDDRINLLAVWTKNAQPSRMGYIGQFWQYLQHHSSLWSDETIICGDFNSNAIWDQPGRPWNHSECVRALEGMGFLSRYHLATGERQGGETLPTLYLQRNLAKPYHVDYIFTRDYGGLTSVASLHVGSAEDWLSVSDHMPIMAELA